ncbi:MAG: phage tail tape measure protein [Acutalibacteraceae bacterium]
MAASGKIIDATLRFQDKFTDSMGKAVKKIEQQQSRLNKVSSKLTKIGRNMTKTGKSLTAGVTAPIAALGVTAVKTAADFEAGMSNVKAISGASEKAISKLTKKAQEMGAKTKFSATESAEAFSYMAMAGWKTKDMLDGIEGIMYLAGATGEDLASTSDIVTDALTAFGMKASDTNRFVDVLAKAANNANTNVSMMGETFKYVAPVAGALGYSVEDMAVGIGLMANSGIKASKAGTALRSMLTNLAKPSKSVKAAMKELNISMTNSDGTMKSFSELMGDLREKFSGLTQAQKASYASTLAGKTGMSGLLAIVNASQSDFDKLTNSIQNSTGAAKEMYDVANDNLNGKLTVLKSTAESIAISFGNKLSPTVSKLTGFLQGLADKVNGLSDKQVDMIVKIAGVAAAIGPLLIAGGKLFTFGGKLIKGIKTMKTVLGVAKGAMTALSPTGLIVIAVIGALALVAVAVYKNWDKIKPVLLKVGDKIKDICGMMKEKYISIKEKISDMITHAAQKFRIFKEKIQSSTGVIGAVYHNIKTYFGNIKLIFSGIIQFVKGVFTGNWKSAWEGVKNIFKGIFGNLALVIKAPLNGVIGLINSAIGQINKIKIDVPEWVPVVGGKHFGGNIPTIPFLYRGTDFWSGGVASVNEKGGEIIDLPRGSRVIPHDESIRTAYRQGRSSGKGRVIHIAKIADTVVIREDADIDRLADKLAEKLEEVEDNIA